MRSDLQQATHLLEHTGGAVQEQAQLNHHLQEQMQQVGGLQPHVDFVTYHKSRVDLCRLGASTRGPNLSMADY